MGFSVRRMSDQLYSLLHSPPLSVNHSITFLTSDRPPLLVARRSPCSCQCPCSQVVVTAAGDVAAVVEDVTVVFPHGSPLEALVHRVRYIDIEVQSDCDGDVS
jgi:hypothetical protein